MTERWSAGDLDNRQGARHREREREADWSHRSVGLLKRLDLVSCGDDRGVLSADNLSEAATEVLLERRLVLGHRVVLTGGGGCEHAAGIVAAQCIFQRDPPAVEGCGHCPALVDVISVLVTESNDLSVKACALFGQSL